MTENSRASKVGCSYFPTPGEETGGGNHKNHQTIRFYSSLPRPTKCNSRCIRQTEGSVLMEACVCIQQAGELQGTADLLVASSSSESKQEVDSSSLLMKDEQLSYSAPPRPIARDE